MGPDKVADGRYRDVALGAVDDLVGHEPAGCLLEGALAPVGELEQHSNGHVGDRSAVHRLSEAVQQRGPPGVGIEVGVPVTGERDVPVARVMGRAVGLDHADGRRRQLADARQDRAACGRDRVERQAVVQRDGVDSRVGVAAGHQRRKR